MIHNLYIALMGVSIILAILIFLSIAVTLLSKQSKRGAAKKDTAEAEQIPNEVIAAISGAVYALFGEHALIKSIKAKALPSENAKWKAQAKYEAIHRNPHKDAQQLRINHETQNHRQWPSIRR
ncbi:MAG: OadG family protein [Bradymonadales bacterium]